MISAEIKQRLVRWIRETKTLVIRLSWWNFQYSMDRAHFYSAKKWVLISILFVLIVGLWRLGIYTVSDVEGNEV